MNEITKLLGILMLGRIGKGCLPGCLFVFGVLLVIGVVLSPITCAIDKYKAHKELIRRSAIESLNKAEAITVSEAVINTATQILRDNPEDREMKAALGHWCFSQRHKRSDSLQDSFRYLDNIVQIKDNDSINTIPLSRWDGRARYDLAVLYFEKKDFRKTLDLLNGLDFPNTCGGVPAEEELKMIHFKAQVCESNNLFVEAVGCYLSYLRPRIDGGCMTDEDKVIFLHAFDLTLKNCRMDNPQSTNPNLFTGYGLGGRTEPLIFAVKDPVIVKKAIDMLKSAFPDSSTGERFEKQWKKFQEKQGQRF